MKYLLITAARNEERFIEGTLRSVTSQTWLPEQWLIMDDGSTDRTAEIVRRYSASYPWIQLVTRPERRERSFAGKAQAVNAALERIGTEKPDVVGNLDADITFEPDYMSYLMEKFAEDPHLGVAGTPFKQDGGYDSTKDSFEGENYVAGPCQLFRYDCFTDIGGYVANRAGGVDWIAVMTARMRGWKVRSFPGKRYHHHRSMGTAERSELAALFSYGEKDYYLGGSPVWQLFRVAYRMTKTPRVLGGLALLFGYSWAALRRVNRPISAELMRFHRADQMRKLKAIFGSLLQLRKADSFSLSSHESSVAKIQGPAQLRDDVEAVTTNFVNWLSAYGQTSWDHQSFFAGPVGGWAKALYYRNKVAGTAAVAPMILCEAFLPSARLLFHKRIRFPIADAHYAMGFALLYKVTLETSYLSKAIHFLKQLQESRCPQFKEYCWGYPFDWVTRNGVIPAQTPLITSTPYAFEAFLEVYRIDSRPEWLEVLSSIARHAANDIKDFPTSDRASSCSYTPSDRGGVINAAAYRASLLTNASHLLQNEEYATIAERNLRFVLENQNENGSWPYAMDGVRDFVDHYHTCFVMKALAKIHSLTGDGPTLAALRRGVDYYLANLFDLDGLPKPFSRAPRLIVYKRELYDCAECINLCLLLQDRFPQLKSKLQTVLAGVVNNWTKPDGSFRSRRLHLSWDNVPMHRWGQSQMFRSLALFLQEEHACQQMEIESEPLQSDLLTLNR
jgi:glycosyltransferase involved in cell wall biosynthesis